MTNLHGADLALRHNMTNLHGADLVLRQENRSRIAGRLKWSRRGSSGAERQARSATPEASAGGFIRQAHPARLRRRLPLTLLAALRLCR